MKASSQVDKVSDGQPGLADIQALSASNNATLKAAVELDPAAALIEMAGGYALPRVLHAVTDLGVADALDDTPRTAAQLAVAVGANPDALGRALRVLSAYGVFQASGDSFQHTAASKLLCSNNPQSVRAIVQLFGQPYAWNIFGALEHSIRTGNPSMEIVLPEGIFKYFETHPDVGAIFNRAMSAKAQAHVSAIVNTYDFSAFGTVADIGGGRGHLLRAVLEKCPDTRGVLFDLPHVVEDARKLGSSERLTFHGGSFFENDLPVADAYTVMEVIHDWNDEDSLKILSAIRRAAPAESKLLLLEQVPPDTNEPHWAKLLDIHMLALLGGRQRIAEGYRSILENSGFAMTQVIETPAGISIVEAVPK